MKNYYHFWLEVNSGPNTLEERVLDKLAANPVHIFQLMYSMKLLNELEEIKDENAQEILKKNKDIKETIGWPTDVDFKGAIHGLLRVQYTYQLPISKSISL